MQPPAETKSTFYRYRHWLIYACIYALIMFVLVFQLDRVNVVALCLSVGLFLATAELVAAWCVQFKRFVRASSDSAVLQD